MAVDMASLPDEILAMVLSQLLRPHFRPWPLNPAFDEKEDVEDLHYFGHNANKKDLFRASLVSKRWLTFAEPLLFYSIYMEFTRDSEIPHLQLPLVNRSPSPCRHVQHLDITVPTECINYCLATRCNDVKHVVLWFSTFLESDINSIVTMLSTMPQLQSLVLTFVREDVDEWDLEEQDEQMTSLFVALRDTLGTNAATRAKSLHTLEVRNAPLVSTMDAFLLFVKAIPVRHLSLWDCSFPDNAVYLEELIHLGLVALSLDARPDTMYARIEGLHTFASLCKLRIGYKVGEGPTQVVNELPRNLTMVCLTDPDYQLVELILRLAMSPEFLPKLEYLGVGVSGEDSMEIFSPELNGLAEVEAELWRITDSMRSSMLRIGQVRTFQVQPANLPERILTEAKKRYGIGHGEVEKT